MTPTALQQLARANRDIETKQKAAAFTEVCRFILLGKGNLGNTLYEAQAARASPEIVEAIRAASAAGTTNDGSFASPLALSSLSDAFLSSLRNVGAFDSALPFSKQIPLNTIINVTTVGATAASIGEGSAKIVSRLSLAASTLRIRKAVAILIASDELTKIGGTLASKLFATELQRAVAAETDAQFLSVLTNSITPISSSGSNAAGIAADLAALLGGLSLDSQSKVFVMLSPNDMRHISVQITSIGSQAFPGVTISGGNYIGITFVPSDAVSGQLIAFDASQLIMASQGLELDASNQSAIQMDSVPDSPPSASTPAISFWQMNLTGLRCTRFWGTERCRSGAVSVISGINYGSANSPA